MAMGLNSYTKVPLSLSLSLSPSIFVQNLIIHLPIVLQKKLEFKWFPGKSQNKLSIQQDTVLVYVPERHTKLLNLSSSFSIFGVYHIYYSLTISFTKFIMIRFSMDCDWAKMLPYRCMLSHPRRRGIVMHLEVCLMCKSIIWSRSWTSRWVDIFTNDANQYCLKLNIQNTSSNTLHLYP